MTTRVLTAGATFTVFCAVVFGRGTERPPSGTATVSDSAAVLWLASRATRIRSIDPANTDFSDLRPLAEAIGDSRVLGCGNLAAVWPSLLDGLVFIRTMTPSTERPTPGQRDP